MHQVGFIYKIIQGCTVNRTLKIILQAALWLWGWDSACSRNEYQQCFLGGQGGLHVPVVSKSGTLNLLYSDLFAFTFYLFH